MVRSILAFGLICFTAVGVLLSANKAHAQERVGVWELTCDSGLCQAFINVKDPKADKVLLTWSIFYTEAQDTYSMIVRTPVRVALRPGVRVWLKDQDFADIPYQVCDGAGCEAVAVLSSRIRNGLSAKEKTNLAFIRYGSAEPDIYEVPITGFGEALASLKTLK